MRIIEGSIHKKDIRLVDAEARESAPSLRPCRDRIHWRDDADECSCETEHQAEEPEDICCSSQFRARGGNLPQGLNAFLSGSDVLLQFDWKSGHNRRE